MLEEILYKGIKRPKQKRKREIKQECDIKGEILDRMISFDSLSTKPVFESPRLVQQIVIPYILKDKNVCVRSFTGSGKTLSFVLPLLELGRERCVKALILVPSDQLVLQICKVVEEIENDFQILKTTPVDSERNTMVICKPEDLKGFDVCTFTHLVIDEADLMINKESLGLFKSLSRFLDFQTATVCVFSATLNKEVENILGMLKSFTRIYISNRNLLCHKFIFGTKNELKHLSLKQVIDDGVETPCLIFVNDLEKAKRLKERIPHSDVFEGDEETLNKFRLKKIWFLFTSDVLSRGVDFFNTKSVINYDFPQSKTDFVHRAGRVNRNTTGQKVISLYTVEDFDRLWYVVEFLKENGNRVEEHIENIIKKKGM